MQQRPQVHDPVVLRDHADRRFESRVENLAEGLVVVAQPPGLPDDDGFVNGTELSVVWAESVDSVAVLPTQILAAHMQGPAKVWSLVVTGPASLEQRRRAERVDVSGPVTLRPPPGVATAAVDGGLIDLSEGALRCSIRTGSADGFLGSRNQVVAEFGVGTADFALPGRVEFVRATKHPTQWEELVVLFAQPVARVDVLRKHLFAQAATKPLDRDGSAES